MLDYRKIRYDLLVARKNPAAVALGKRSGIRMTPKERQERGRNAGLLGGKARAEKLTPAQRSESAKQAALARWGKK
jgi:hypothetical protein